MDKNGWIVVGCLLVFGLLAFIMTKLSQTDQKPFLVSREKAVEVSKKLVSIFENHPAWFMGVAINGDSKNGYFLELRFNSDILPLTPVQIEFFQQFSQTLDGVKVYLITQETIVGLRKQPKTE
jgi:hypothetical protein